MHQLLIFTGRQRVKKQRSQIKATTHHVIQLLQGPLLRLGNEQEYHAKRNDVQTAVETKSALNRKGSDHLRPRERQHGGPEEARGDGPGHADFAVGEREDFCRVGERDRTFAGGVKGGEDENEEGNKAEMCRGGDGDEEAHASGE